MWCSLWFAAVIAVESVSGSRCSDVVSQLLLFELDESSRFTATPTFPVPPTQTPAGSVTNVEDCIDTIVYHMDLLPLLRSLHCLTVPNGTTVTPIPNGSDSKLYTAEELEAMQLMCRSAIGDYGIDTQSRLISIATLALMNIAVLFGVGWQTVVQLLRKKASDELQPVVTALLGKLATSGAIAFCMFWVQKSGLVAWISALIFGDTEAGRLVLQNRFALVRVGVFLVTLTFFVLVSVLILVGSRWTSQYRAIQLQVDEGATPLATLRSDFLKKVCSTGYRPCGAIRGLLPWVPTEGDWLRRVVDFVSMRKRFIDSMVPAGVPTIPSDFDFAFYMTRRVGTVAAEVIAIPPTTWFLMFGIVTLVWLFTLVPLLGFDLWNFVAVFTLMFIISVIFVDKLMTIYQLSIPFGVVEVDPEVVRKCGMVKEAMHFARTDVSGATVEMQCSSPKNPLSATTAQAGVESGDVVVALDALDTPRRSLSAGSPVEDVRASMTESANGGGGPQGSVDMALTRMCRSGEPPYVVAPAFRVSLVDSLLGVCCSRFRPGAVRGLPHPYLGLFWGGENGRSLFIGLTRVLILGTAFYIAFIPGMVIPKEYDKCVRRMECVGGPGVYVAFMVVFGFELIAMVILLTRAILLLSIVLSIEHFRDVDSVCHETVRQIKTTILARNAVRMLRCIQQLQMMLLSSGRGVGADGAQRSLHTLHPHVKQAKLSSDVEARFRRRVRELFNMFDKDRSGLVEHEELVMVFERLGTTPEAADELSKDLLIEHGQDGAVKFEGLYKWMLVHFPPITKETVPSVVDGLFKLLDEDGSGTISNAELFQAMTRVSNTQFSEQDARYVIAVMDADGDGEMSKGELQAFLLQHIEDL